MPLHDPLLQQLHLPIRRALLLTVCLISLVARVASAQEGNGGASPLDVRELGRLERPDMVSVILPFLSDTAPAVRVEAANSLAQSVWQLRQGEHGALDSTAVLAAVGALRARLSVERVPVVVEAILRSLGRIPYQTPADVLAAERAIAPLLALGSDTVVVTGAAKAMESLARSPARAGALSARTIALLRALVRDGGASPGPGGDGTSLVRARRLAMMALVTAAAVDSTTIARAMADDDAQLRRLAALAAGAPGVAAHRAGVLGELLHDPEAMVHTEAVRSWAHRPGGDCTHLMRAATDSAPHVSLTAIGALGSSCGPRMRIAAAGLLAGLVRAGSDSGAAAAGTSRRVARHRAAHALVSLAQLSPQAARTLLPRAAAWPTWQMRMYAARAAAELGDTAALVLLAGDRNPNVRTDAISGLARVAGHTADSIYLASLAAGDYQLVLTAAGALRGTPEPDPAVRALLAALARITAERRETSRDPRMAIVKALGELGSSGTAGALVPYLTDFDPVLADSVAGIVSRWTGRVYRAAPHLLPEVDRPLDDPEAIRRARVRFTMTGGAGGGTFEIRLFPYEAPATVSRFVRLVRSGYYDGLTVHRVVPNFVVQGGSPGANEYMGDGPYMRDEVGLRSHERGTVGISTRGRDTGDAQFFINLVDNPRLDHEYTVFAKVTAGMDTVDQLLEGDEIARVQIIFDR